MYHWLMFLVPSGLADTLASKCLSVLQETILESNFKNEDQVEETRKYLCCLPKSTRLQLALKVQKEMTGKFRLYNPHMSYLRYKQWRKFLMWEAVCFLPDVKDMPIVMRNVAFEHFSRYMLLYLANGWVGDLQNKSLELGLDYTGDLTLQHDDLVPHLRLVLPQFTLLQEVTLGQRVGDECLEIIGHMCKNLTKLKLAKGNKVTNDGFITFAQNQKDNDCLEEICFDLTLGPDSSRISIIGLSQVWLLPLSVKKLNCHVHQLDFADDSITLDCPNGPSKLTFLSLNWREPDSWDGFHLQETIRRFLDCKETLFPHLKSMEWTNPPHSLLTLGKTWDTVEFFNQKWDFPVSLTHLDKSFPNLGSVSLENLFKQETLCLKGCFRQLRRFVYFSDLNPLFFAMFSEILRQVPSLRVISVYLASDVINEYTDDALCKLFLECESLKHLESFRLFNHCQTKKRKIPLTLNAVNCILERCQDIKLLGDLFSWILDGKGEGEEFVITDDNRFANPVLSGRIFSNLDHLEVKELYGSMTQYLGVSC